MLLVPIAFTVARRVGVSVLMVGLPLFFEVGFVLLVPIAFTVARRVGVSVLMVGLPM